MDQERALPDLPGLLDLDPVPGGEDGEHFLGQPSPDRSSPVYGGHVAAQALAAAGRTVPDGLRAHSVHCSFVRPAVPDIPFDHRVERVRSSAAFATRRVYTAQRGREVFALTASFHRGAPGLDHQDEMPRVPAPEELPAYEERLTAAFGEPFQSLGKPYELRFVGPLSFDLEKDPSLATPWTRIWVRLKDELPAAATADRAHLLHACLLTYLTDVTMLETVLVRNGVSWLRVVPSSIDHTVWIHRPFRADEWLLCAHESPAASQGRGLVLGRVFTRDGTLVATLAQEGLLRLNGGTGERG